MTQLSDKLRATAESLKRKAEVRGKPEVSHKELMDAYYVMQEAADAVETITEAKSYRITIISSAGTPSR